MFVITARSVQRSDRNFLWLVAGSNRCALPTPLTRCLTSEPWADHPPSDESQRFCRQTQLPIAPKILLAQGFFGSIPKPAELTLLSAYQAARAETARGVRLTGTSSSSASRPG